MCWCRCSPFSAAVGLGAGMRGGNRAEDWLRTTPGHCTNFSRRDMEPITPADSAGLLRAVWIAAGEKEKACYSSFSSSSAAFLRRLRLLFGVGAAPITLPNCGTFGGSYGLSVK